MQYIIIVIFLFLFIGCKDSKISYCWYMDIRCQKIINEARKKGRETGVCYQPKEGELVSKKDNDQIDPDHRACEAIYAEAWAKCDALPQDGPDKKCS